MTVRKIKEKLEDNTLLYDSKISLRLDDEERYIHFYYINKKIIKNNKDEIKGNEDKKVSKINIAYREC